jgi:hypothetical protein
MPITFTTEELLQFLYGETNPDLTQQIKEESRRDPLLMEHLETLKTTLTTLDNIVESPRVESVLNVLRYARDTAPAASHG